MKKLILVMTCALCITAHSQTEQTTQAQEVARAVDVLIAAYHGAQQEIAKQTGTSAVTLSASEKQKIQQEAGEAIRTLQQFSQDIRQGQTQQAAEHLLALQAQINRASGQNRQELAQVAQYLRCGGEVYHRWQQQAQVQDIKQASAEQIDSLLTAVQAELEKGSATEREIGQFVGGAWGILRALDDMARAPEPYAAERQALSSEIQALQALAEQQGIGHNSQTQRVEGLLQLLKLRVAERQIHMSDAQAEQQLINNLQEILRNPQAIFTPQQFVTIERLLAQLGSSFSETHRTWIAKEKFLVKQ